jgi:hypothetical protein
MIQTTPHHLAAMRPKKKLTTTQKKLELSEKIIADLQKPLKRPLPEAHAESFPAADKDFDNLFSMAFLNDLWQNTSQAGPSLRHRQFRGI